MYIERTTHVNKYLIVKNIKLKKKITWKLQSKKKKVIRKSEAKIFIFVLLLRFKSTYFFNFRLKHTCFVYNKKLKSGRKKLKLMKRFKKKFFKNKIFKL